MIKFIPDKVDDSVMYSKSNYLFSFNMRLYMRVGVRGTGKTFDGKIKASKFYKYKKKPFIWLRATEAECDKMGKNEGYTFFADIAKVYPEYSDSKRYRIKGDRFLEGKNVMGFLLPMSTYYKEKGNAYPDSDLIVFDEVIPERIQRNYVDRVEALGNVLETVARSRPEAKAILLSNALDRGDPILAQLGFDLTEFGYYINTNKKTICHYERPTLTYQRAHAKGLGAIFLEDSTYSDNILGNKFKDESEYFKKRPNNCKLVYIIHDLTDFAARVYVCEDGYIYISNDFNRQACQGMRYTTDIMSVSATRKFITPNIIESLKRVYINNMCRFENSKVKQLVVNLIA